MQMARVPFSNNMFHYQENTQTRNETSGRSVILTKVRFFQAQLHYNLGSQTFLKAVYVIRGATLTRATQ